MKKLTIQTGFLLLLPCAAFQATAFSELPTKVVAVAGRTPFESREAVASATSASDDQNANKHTGIAIGVGIKASTLGLGVDAAIPIASRANLRVGFNGFDYNRSSTNDGITYQGTLRLRSVEALVDWFPFQGGFRVSPGLLIYNGNKVTANASVPGGRSFSLGGTTYISNPANPVAGNGKVDLNTAAPMAVFGWGNLVPRTRHFSALVDLGVVFQGAPSTKLNLGGSACTFGGTNCRNVATEPGIQSDIQAQQRKLDNKLSAFKYYPVISVGFSYRF